MATTEKGIYYPNDGTQPADVLADMKKMAESMEEAINNNKFNPKEINDNITKIQEEQTTQNKAIEANTTAIEENTRSIKQNTTDITKLQEENAMLKAQIPKGQASGKEINLQDSAEMELIDFNLQGNSYQQNEPTLENLSEVQAVGDNINLYPYENIPFQSDTTTESWCYVDGKIGAYGNTVTDKTDYKITLEKGKYYFKLETDDSNIITGGLVANDTNSEKQLTLFDNAFEITKTTVCTLRLKVANPSLGINIKSIKLEKGTVSTPYSQYGQGSIEIVKSNKNILDLGQHSVAGITFNKNKITIKNPTSYAYASNCNLLGNKFLSGKSVTFKFIIDGTLSDYNANYPSVNVNTNKGNYKYQQHIAPNTYKNYVNAITRNFTEDEYITGINVYTTGATCDLTILVQAEINTNTDFIEHQGNTYTLAIQKPFYKIGDYADKFIKQVSKRYEQHIIKEYTITGNENFVQADTDRFYITNLITSIASENSVNCLSNYFKGDTYSNRWTANKVTARTNSLTFCTNSGYTLDTFKAKLQELNAAGTPVKVYYVSTTSELIECTAEQTQILEQIIADGTYKEVTHFYTTEDLKPTIEVKYYKDLETLFKNQEQMQATLDNVQAQLLDLGGNLDE